MFFHVFIRNKNELKTTRTNKMRTMAKLFHFRVELPKKERQGLVSRKSRELLGPEKAVVKLHSACFEKLIFLHVFNIRKIKRISRFEGLEPRRCEDIKGIVVPRNRPEKFRHFWERGPWTPRTVQRSMSCILMSEGIAKLFHLYLSGSDRFSKGVRSREVTPLEKWFRL